MEEDLERMADVLRELEVNLSQAGIVVESKASALPTGSITLRDWFAVAFASRGSQPKDCYNYADQVLEHR